MKLPKAVVVLLRFCWYLVQVFRQGLHLELLAAVLLVGTVLTCLALGLIMYWPLLTR